MRFFKSSFSIFLVTTLINCAGPARNASYTIRPGSFERLQSVKSLYLGNINCQDTLVSKAIRNLFVQEFLRTDVIITKDSITDAEIEFTVTTTSDASVGGNSVATKSIGTSSFSGSGGSYVSGITAQIF